MGAIEFYAPYISGYTDGSFRLKNYVTRAEVANMFTTIINLNVDFPGSAQFTDVTPTHWAYPYIQAMYRVGLFTGYVDANGIEHLILSTNI